MNNLQGIMVQLSVQAGQFKAGMLQAAQSVRQLNQELRQAAVSARAASKSIGDDLWKAAAKGNQGARGLTLVMAGLSAAILAAAGAATAGAIELERNMQNVATIWDESAQKATGSLLSLEDATKGVVQLSRELPQSAATAAEGLYQVASSGFQGTDAMKVLEAAMTAASAGLTNTETAARGITAVLNAYGMNATRATEVSDILFETVNLGIISFGELSNVLGDFVGLTAQAGVEFDEAAAALATMTLAGVTTAEAGTSLNRVMQAFIDPSVSMVAILQELGYESGFAALEQEGLHGIMTRLRGEIGQNVESWSMLFPEIRGLRGALGLVAANGANYNRVAAQMTNENERLNATKKALADQAESTSFQLQLLWNNVAALGMELADQLLPLIKYVAEAFRSWTGAIEALPGWLKVAGAGVLLLTGLVGALGAGFLLLAPRIQAANAMLAANTAAARIASVTMRGFLVTLGPLAAAFALATPLLMAWGKEHATQKQNIKDFTAALEAETGAVEENIAAVVRKKIADQGLDDMARTAGISLEELIDAMVNGGPALDELQRKLAAAEATGTEMRHTHAGVIPVMTEEAKAASKLSDALGKNSDELEAAKEEHRKKLEIDKASGRVIGNVTNAVNANTEAERLNAVAVEESAKRREAMIDNLMDLVDVMDIYNAALDVTKTKEDATSDSAKQAAEDAGEARRRALDDQLTAEERAMEDMFTIRERAMEDQFRLEEQALEDSRDLIDARHKAAKDALEDESQELRRQFDDRWDIEEEGLRNQIQLIEEVYDKRRRAAEKAYEKEREELEWQRDQLFGMEWQAAQDRLDLFDEAHEDQMAAIDNEEEDVVAGVKSEFEERKETEKEELDDLIDLREKKLEELHQVEIQAWEDQKATARRAFEDRKTAAERAWQDEKTAIQRSFEDRKGQLERNLDDLNEKERQGAEKRRQTERDERPPTLAEWQKTLDERVKQMEGMNADLAIIATRSGQDINSALMVEISKLPPQMIAQIAGAGEGMFNKVIEGMQTASTAMDPAKIGEPVLGLLKRIGDLAGPEFAMSLAASVSNDPRAAEILREKLLELIAPVQVQPGVWATPRPKSQGGGYYPTKMTFADGGEYHQAQIARPTWRVWAEPETGGEAYIPLAMSKRMRSLSVLQTVADRFGYGLVQMADGGLLAGRPSLSGGSVRPNINIDFKVDVNAHVAAGVDTDAVGRAIRREVDRGVAQALDTLERQVVVKAWRN